MRTSLWKVVHQLRMPQIIYPLASQKLSDSSNKVPDYAQCLARSMAVAVAMAMVKSSRTLGEEAQSETTGQLKRLIKNECCSMYYKGAAYTIQQPQLPFKTPDGGLLNQVASVF
jgi:hypothetical protein